MRPSWLTNNFWMKILALILAVGTWLYVNIELKKENTTPNKVYHSLEK